MSKETDVNMERIGKLVQLAKRGEGGEKLVALNIIKRLCEKYGLDMDELMSDDEKLQEFEVSYKNAFEMQVAVQVVYRYAVMSDEDGVRGNDRYKTLYFKTTKEKYIETLNALDTLLKLYRRERVEALKVLEDAFIYKHDLYYQPTPEERKKRKKREKEPTEKERKRSQRAAMMAGDLEDADITKRLGSGA